MKTLVALALLAAPDSKPDVKPIVEKAGVTYDEKCVEPVDAFPGVTLVGSFRTEYGCRWLGYVASGAFHAGLRDASAALDWAKLDAAQRPERALAWVRDVLHRGELLQSPYDLPKERFRAPAATAKKDGGVRVEGWRVIPSGMVPVWRAERIAVDVDAAGNFGADRQLEQFEKKR